MTTLLLIEDDRRLTEPLQYQLGMLGYRVLVAHTGPLGLELANSETPDLIVLDIMLPGLTGWQVCEHVREFSQVPIIMLTALGQEVDRLRGLEMGADDYLTKPFSFQELVARIRSMLRRVQWDQNLTPDAEIRIGAMSLNLDAHRALKNGVELILRHKEYDLLSLLMNHAGKVVTRETLFNQVWGTDWMGDTRTLDVHVRWLRQKIEDDPAIPHYIQTIRNVGYRFATGEEAAQWPK